MQSHVPFSVYILGILIPLTVAYEIAFYPNWFYGLASEDEEPLYFHVYPRFQCNKIVADPGVNPRHTQNVLVRVSEEAIGPGLIVFYDAGPDDDEPCHDENARSAAYFFKNNKPSQQLYYTHSSGYMTHFMEVDDTSELWSLLVDWVGIKPGSIATRDDQKNEDGEDIPKWIEDDTDEVEVFAYDHDHGYNTGGEYSFGEDSEENMREPAEGVNLPEMEPEYGNEYAPGQKVPDHKVYWDTFRNWRNARIRFGGYRPITKEFTDKYSVDELRNMGYIIDDEKETQIRQQRDREKQQALNDERAFEKARYDQMEDEEKYTQISSRLRPPIQLAGGRLQPNNQGFLEDVINPFNTGVNNVYNYGMFGGQDDYMQQQRVEIEEEKDNEDYFLARYGGPGQILEYEADNEAGTGTDYLSTTQFLSENQGLPPRSPLYDNDNRK
ncbi:hypothetical protein TWF718_006109 [Orbilia javanica]|uniref:Uncharacterized protein n=1 Tax=Orbilia javanica TaxID=47235 RepID=A0AAN8N289_9PEZI